MRDVALEAGVSAQTVSRYLRNPGDLLEETRERIRLAISRTAYVPNLVASHLASNKSMTVAAILPTLSASVFAGAVSGLTDVLATEGYQVFVGNTGYSLETEESIVRRFLGRRPDGFFFIGTQHSQATIAMLHGAGVPVVESWEWSDDPVDMLVGFSNEQAMAALVEALVGRGYRRPVFAGLVREGDHRAEARLRGYSATVARLLPNVTPTTVLVADGPGDLEVGRDLMAGIIKRYPETDVVLFPGDLQATGALLEANRLGIDVPGRLAITGFGDYDIGSHLDPTLTTVAVRSHEIGRLSAKLLLDRLEKRHQGPSSIDVGFEVLIRGSVDRS